MTSVAAPPQAARFQPCLKAVNGVIEFLRETLPKEKLEQLDASYDTIDGVASRIYDSFATSPQIIAVLSTVRDTERCHVAVFVDAIRRIKRPAD